MNAYSLHLSFSVSDIVNGNAFLDRLVGCLVGFCGRQELQELVWTLQGDMTSISLALFDEVGTFWAPVCPMQTKASGILWQDLGHRVSKVGLEHLSLYQVIWMFNSWEKKV